MASREASREWNDRDLDRAELDQECREENEKFRWVELVP